MSSLKTNDHRLDPVRLRELFDYNAETGALTWRISQSSRSVVGAVAGTINKHHGRRLVCVDGLQHYAHRVAWTHFHGAVPDGEIDHINGIPSDNRISNLRVVDGQTNAENKRNPRSDKKHGRSLGAYPSYGGRWRAQIVVKGKAIHLGCFATEEMAYQAYLDAKRRMHAGCTI